MSYPPYSDQTLQSQGSDNDCSKVAVTKNKGYSPQPEPVHPTQQAYPHQGPGYHPRHPTQGYTSQQSLSEFKDGPPAYNTANPPAATPVVQQQAAVHEQPTPTVNTNTVRPVSDDFLILSIVLTICCFFCCSYHGLLCTIPALIFAIRAQDARQHGDDAAAKTHSRISLALNIAAIVFWIVIAVVIIISISTTVSGGNDGSSYDSSDSSYSYIYRYRYSYTDSYCYYHYYSYYYYNCYYHTRYRTGYYK